MTPLLFPLRGRIVLVLLVFWAARASAAEKPTPAYRTNQVQGWQLIIDERLLSTGSSNATARAMELLETQLKEIVRNVPSAAVDRLRQVPLWFSPAYPGVVERAEYHPGESWLHANGRNPAMAARIKALHDGGARALVAVGALHMTGPQALTVLLKRMGFEVERIQ